MKFRGYVKYSVKGLNQERFFNRASKEMNLFEIIRHERNMASFKVRMSYAGTLEKLVQSNGLELVQKKHIGLAMLLIENLKRWGIITAVFVFLCLNMIVSNFILRIEIYGNETLNTEDIIYELESVGAGMFSNKNGLKKDKVEAALIERIPSLSFVSIFIKGQTLIVNVKERLLPSELDDVFLPIVAGFDGEIVSVKLISGTPVVGEGDIVKAGDILILPVMDDSSGIDRPVIANAEITAKVWITGKSVHYDVEPIKVKTGNSTTVITAELFSFELYRNGKEPIFSDFILEESKYNLTNSILPIKLHKKVFHETVIEFNETSFDEYREKKLFEAREKALQNLADYEIIKEEYHTLATQAGINTITYVIVVERRIDSYGGDC